MTRAPALLLIAGLLVMGARPAQAQFENVGLGPHDVFNAEPVLKITWLDHEKDRQAAIGVLGPFGGESQGHRAFRRIVDDHEEFPRMTFFV